MPTIRDVQLDRLITRDQDLHGRRIRNASPSELSGDYVIREEIVGLAKDILDKFNTLANAIANITVTDDTTPPPDIGTGNVLFQKQTITANTIVTTSFSAAVDGNFLIVVLIMGPVAGKTIDWDTDMFANAFINLDVSIPGLVIVNTFVSVNGLWYAAALPSTGIGVTF